MVYLFNQTRWVFQKRSASAACDVGLRPLVELLWDSFRRDKNSISKEEPFHFHSNMAHLWKGIGAGGGGVFEMGAATFCLVILTNVNGVLAAVSENETMRDYVSWKEFSDFVISEHTKHCKAESLCNATKTTNRCSMCSPCRCDVQCAKYGDCCPDRALEITRNGASPARNYRCQNEAFKFTLNDKPDSHVFLVSECSLQDTNSSLVKLCEDPSHGDIYLNRPVTSISRTPEVYRNEYCAMCNGDYTFRLWGIHIKCKDVVSFPEGTSQEAMMRVFLKEPTCLVLFSPPVGSQHRRCYASSDVIIRTCNVTGKWIAFDANVEKACHSYYNPHKADSHIFRNVFCWMCNSDSLFGSYFCPYDIPYPFSVLMDPDAVNRLQTRAMKKICQCEEGQVFDKYQKICHTLHCSSIRRLEGYTCVSVFAKVKGLPYFMELTLRPEDEIIINMNMDLWVPVFAESLKKAFSYLLGDISKLDSLFRVRLHANVNQTTHNNFPPKISKVILFIKFFSPSEEFLDVLEQRLIQMRHTVWSIKHGELLMNFTSQPSWTENGTVGKYRTVTITSTNGSLMYIYDYHKPVRGRFGEPIETIPSTYNYSFVAETLRCPKIQLTDGVDYYFDEMTNRLRLVFANVTLDGDQFEMSADGIVWVCYDLFAPNETRCNGEPRYISPQNLYSTAMLVLTIVCNSLSMLCLLTTFIVFMLFPSMRSLPVKNTMGLIFAMFCETALYTFGVARVELPTACTTIGILIHFFLLSTFTWMSICTIHMYRVFRDVLKSRTSKSAERKMFLLHCFYSVILPAVIVSCTIALNYALSDGEDIGYGQGICYISNALSLLAVGVPLLIMTVTNTGLFTVTIISLRRASKEQKYLKQKNAENFTIYIKLSTLTGINWLFGILASLIRSDALWYCFTVTCGLQGLYIFIAFVCNRRVSKQFRDRFQTERTSSQGRSKGTDSSKTSSGQQKSACAESTKL